MTMTLLTPVEALAWIAPADPDSLYREADYSPWLEAREFW